MNEIAGAQVFDDKLVRGFLRELEILANEGYLTFTAYDSSEQTRRSWPYQYLEQVRDFALTVRGQDRAHGIVVKQPLPNPDQDDNRPISALVLQQIAQAIAEEYSPPQVLAFLDEAGIPLDRLPPPEGTPDVRDDRGGFVCGVLLGLDQWGSEGRRILREFMGSWLDDRFISGRPTSCGPRWSRNSHGGAGMCGMAHWSLANLLGARGHGARSCGTPAWRPCILRSWPSLRSCSRMDTGRRPSSKQPKRFTTG
jgi:hypothetical protein